MEINIPLQVTSELTQILSNLVLGDNEIRSNAEKVVNERLTQTPEVYILAMAQFSTTTPDEQMRSFSLILLRRLLFRSINPSSSGARLTLYDHLSENTRGALERTVLSSLLDEPSPSVKNKAADTITDLANASFARGRPWPALQEAVFRAISAGSSSRESAFRVVERCSPLLADIPPAVFAKGLADTSPDVRLAALKATVAYLSQHPNSLAPEILGRALSILPTAPLSHQTRYLNALTGLAGSHPALFSPHLRDLLHFMPALILNKKEYDAGPTPTVARPFPNASSSSSEHKGRVFQFPPVPGSVGRKDFDEDDEEDEEREEVRRAALEFMVTLSESKPSMVRRVDGWVAALVKGCLEGMGELNESAADLRQWLDADPQNDPTDANYPHVFEQALDRLSCAFNGKPVLHFAFQFIPGMLASHDWRLRHAGLMAIAALGEGGSKVMMGELDKVVSLVTNAFHDSHPRVRYAACQCVGQLCTDLEEIIQAKYHAEIFSVLIPTLEAPEARVHAHAAAALINFCEGVERDTLTPYLDPIVERLLKLLHAQSSEGGNVKAYVQEQAITTLAMVADASETTFAKHYSSIMPLLLNVLQNANGVDHKKLRWKAMECAGLIAIAVGREIFRADAPAFTELLMRIQSSPIDPGDTMLNHYLIATWAKVCQALGPEFEPYLPVVMPPLLAAASAKADVSVWDEDDESKMEDKEGWETMSLDGQQVGIKTSVLEEKCQAFETLVIYCSTLATRFAPYLSQSLELVLPNMRFYFHEGVREACAMILPMLLVCGKQSNTMSPQMLSATFAQLIGTLEAETDVSFLASLYKCCSDCVRVIGGPDCLAPEFKENVLRATRSQLQNIAEKRRARLARRASGTSTSSSNGGSSSSSVDHPDLEEDEKEEVALLEELEDYALDEMGKMLKSFDPNHPLLVAIGSVKELACASSGDESDWDGSDAD